jgi:hypothetical protein
MRDGALVNLLENTSSEKRFSIIKGAYLAGRNRALRFGKLQDRRGLSGCLKFDCPSLRTVTRLRRDFRPSGEAPIRVGNIPDLAASRVQLFRLATIKGNNQFIGVNTLFHNDIRFMTRVRRHAQAFPLAECVEMQPIMLSEDLSLPI